MGDKLKEFFKSGRIFPLSVIIACSMALILRTAQLLTVVDYETMGFFAEGTPFLAAGGIYLFFIIFALLFIGGGYLDRKNGADSFTCKAENISPKYTMLMGIAFGVGFALQFIQVFANFEKFTLGVLGEIVIMAAYLATAFIFFANKGIKRSVGYVQLIISVSFTVKAASLFMQDTIIVRVSDELILLLSYVSSVMFFLAIGRFITGNENKHTREKLLFFGAAAAVLSVAASVAGGLAFLIDSQYMGEHMANHPISEISTAFIAITVILALYGKKKEPNENLEENQISENTENSENKENPQPQA